MLKSMTGYASLSGDDGRAQWDWEIRSVNSKGLDLRVRLPDGCEALEASIRQRAQQHLKRGTVTISLRLQRQSSEARTSVDTATLEAMLVAVSTVEAEASARGIALSTATATDVLSLPGVLHVDTDPLRLPDAAREQIGPLFEALSTMRAVEGAALGQVISGQLAHMQDLHAAATKTTEARNARTGVTLKDKVRQLLSGAEVQDTPRLHQELALIAVKSDVTEELDRLQGHIDAAKGMLKAGGPVGRKLDFLMQEFNREANTLCSKAGAADLTAIGLELKLVIDQMREQIQNLE